MEWPFSKKQSNYSAGVICPSLPTIEFKKQNGDSVKAGEIVVVLEAMKMMNNFEANKDGVISGIKFESGDSVTKGDILFSID